MSTTSKTHARDTLPSYVFYFIMIDTLCYAIIMPVLPTYLQNLGSPTLHIGLVMGFNSLVQLFSAPVLGMISDLYGRRSLMLLCFGATAAGFAALLFFPWLWAVVLFRLLDGLLGGNTILAKACIRGTFDTKAFTRCDRAEL